jgi:hypothetical protein
MQQPFSAKPSAARSRRLPHLSARAGYLVGDIRLFENVMRAAGERPVISEIGTLKRECAAKSA